MNMPGFTAEASLYSTKWRYQRVETQGSSHGEPSVMPQLFIDPFRHILRAFGQGGL